MVSGRDGPNLCMKRLTETEGEICGAVRRGERQLTCSREHFNGSFVCGVDTLDFQLPDGMSCRNENVFDCYMADGIPAILQVSGSHRTLRALDSFLFAVSRFDCDTAR